MLEKTADHQVTIPNSMLVYLLLQLQPIAAAVSMLLYSCWNLLDKQTYVFQDGYQIVIFSPTIPEEDLKRTG